MQQTMNLGSRSSARGVAVSGKASRKGTVSRAAGMNIRSEKVRVCRAWPSFASGGAVRAFR